LLRPRLRYSRSRRCAINNAIWTALYSRLAGGTALTSLLSGGSASIYDDTEVPDGAELPYVVFSWAGGGLIPTSPHVAGNGVVYVRAYTGSGAKAAGVIRDQIFSLLDRQPLTVTGWANPWLAAEMPHIEIVETDESGERTWCNGDHYRLYFSKSS
jgi:Protein of unknown function (DUF3168)